MTNKKRTKSGWRLSGTGASHLFIGLLLLLAPGAAAQDTTDPRILVLPFENKGHEQRLHWLSEASAMLLADELRARGLPAISRDDRVRAFDDLRLPMAGTLSHATVIKVGRLVGASEVIVGAFTIDGDKLKIDAHAIRVDVGRLEQGVTDQAPLTDLFGSFGRLATRIAPNARAPVYSSAYPPLPAFENYIKGLVAEGPVAQAAFLEAAAKASPGYDRAELALWGVRTGLADHVSALAAARAVASSSPLARRARFLAGVSLVYLKRYDEAYGAFKSLTDDGGSAADKSLDISAAWNNLGVIQMRHGSTPETGTPAFFLTKARDASPGDTDVLFNLGYAYLLDRNTQAATYWLREAVRRDPGDADAHFVLAAALQSSATDVEAGRERELARRLSSRYEELERRAAADRLPVPKGLERLRTDTGSAAAGADIVAVNSAQQDQRELVSFHLERGKRLYERQADAEALSELRRAVYLSPYEAQAHLLIGRIHLRAGRTQDAINALKISIWSEDSAAARIALADAYLKTQNSAAARAELERALTLEPNSAEAKKMIGGIK